MRDGNAALPQSAAKHSHQHIGTEHTMKKSIACRSIMTVGLIAGAGYLLLTADHANAGLLRMWIGGHPQPMAAAAWSFMTLLAFVWMIGPVFSVTPVVWAVVVGVVASVAVWRNTVGHFDPTMQRLLCLAACTVVPTLIVHMQLFTWFVRWLYQRRWNQPAHRGRRSFSGCLRLSLSILLGGCFVGALVSAALIRVGYDWRLLGTSEQVWALGLKIGSGLIPFMLAGCGVNRWRLSTLVVWGLASAGLIWIGTSNWGIRLNGLPALSASAAVPVLLLIAAPGALWQVFYFLGHSSGGGGGSYRSSSLDYSSSSYSGGGSSWSTGSSYSPTSSYDSNSGYSSNSSSSSNCTPTYDQNKSYFDSQLAGGGSQQQQQGF